MARSLVVIANAAIRKKRRVAVDEIVAHLKISNSVAFEVTQSADEAKAAARKAIANGAQGVIAAGGDGTVHSILQAVAGTTTALGIIAAGTGNDIASALYRNNRHSFDEERSIDAVKYKDGWFLGVASMGFDARVNERANSMRVLKGKMKYDVAMLAELATLRTQHFDLLVDGQRRDLEATLIAVANTSNYGGGMKIAPDAVADDGLIDVVVVGKVTRRQLLTVFPRVYKGAHVSHPAVQVFRCKTLVVENELPSIYADGEPAGSAPLKFECIPGALQLLH